MLSLTEDAATLICTLTDSTNCSVRRGLRIIVDPVHQSLSMSLADGPSRTDSVVTKDGARVFLSPSAAHRLQSRTLRAEISQNRSSFFLDN